MSGGGGGGGSSRPDPITPVAPKREGGAGGAGRGADVCVLTEDTVINSPVAAAIATLKVDDVLNIVLERGPPVRLVVRTQDGQSAGSITGAKLPQIIMCIEAGVQYQAQVISIKGAAVRVRVSNV